MLVSPVVGEGVYLTYFMVWRVPSMLTVMMCAPAARPLSDSDRLPPWPE